MSRLTQKKYRRLFAFGCSFTQYYWATWPEIVAADLDIPMYNFAECGAGNQYIANTVAQAHRIYNISSDDLVMICWTGTLREDRWVGDWRLTGDITNSTEYDDDFFANHVDPAGGLIRDLAAVCLVRELLCNAGCDHHMFSMVDIWQPEMEQSTVQDTDPATYQRLQNIYQEDLDFLMPSFEKLLWGGNIARAKRPQMTDRWQDRFADWHPQPAEQLEYLSLLFGDHTFSQTTVDLVDRAQHNLEAYISEQLKHQEFFDTTSLGGAREINDVTKQFHFTSCCIHRERFLIPP